MLVGTVTIPVVKLISKSVVLVICVMFASSPKVNKEPLTLSFPKMSVKATPPDEVTESLTSMPTLSTNGVA